MKVDEVMGVKSAPIEVEEQKKEEVPKPTVIAKSNSDEINAILNQEPEKKPEVKKPRAFVADSDLFDFSDVKIITGSDGDKIPAAIEEKPKALKPTKLESTASEKKTKAIHEEKNF